MSTFKVSTGKITIDEVDYAVIDEKDQANLIMMNKLNESIQKLVRNL